MPSSALRTPPALLRAYERHARSLPRIAEVVLVLLLAYALAGLVWRLVPAPAGSAWQAPPEAPLLLGAATQGPNVGLIAGAHLFGEVPLPTDPALTELAEAPDTRLDLTLMGILAATADRGSRALIGASNGEEKPYAIGDDVVRGVRLQAIFPDRVILARGGQLETLRLDKNAPSRSAGGAAPLPTAPTAASSETTVMLSNIRQELLSDPSRASEYIRIQPASSGGQLRGYRIYPGRNRAAFNAVGLRPGDLVTQVNGIQLNDANTALQMLGQLSQANNVSVLVDRGGQQQVVNVNFE